jgi:hypothetical protein
MCARRLGRLLGAALALVALAALVGGILGPLSDGIFGPLSSGGMHTNDFEWGAKFGQPADAGAAAPGQGSSR